MGFTKLDSGILQSSIMAEKPEVFKVWIALLASCDADGLARVSAVFLANACYLSQGVTDKCLDILSSPDKYSRTLENEGRRIERVDGGYFIINYAKYREFTVVHGDPNSPGAIRIRKWREKQKSVTVTPVTLPNVTSASASSSPSSFLEERGVGEGTEKEFQDFWNAWPVKEGEGDARIAFLELRKTVTIEELESAYGGYMNFLKYEKDENNFDRRAKNAATWLTNDRWKEHIGFKRKVRL
jgi:hypothetical protein